VSLEIALVQFAVAPCDPDRNLARMAHFIQQAAARGAQLVVFPEDAVTGPLSGQTAFVAHAPAYLAHFQRLAVKFSVDLVPGSWSIQEGAALYNAAHYINSDGSVAGVYRKINLWEGERALVSPGLAASVFATSHGWVGLAICWDLAFPMLFQEMKAQGAGLVLVPAYWSFSTPAADVAEVEEEGIALIDSLCVSRSFENDLVLAYCNAAGTLRSEGIDAVLSGRSQVVHPTAQALSKSTANDEEIIYATVG
jgi:predicted amidohydrolase